MQMDEGLDTGPEITKEEIEITDSTTAQTLHDQLSELGGNMIIEAINKLASEGDLTNTPQNNDISTYAPMLKKEDGKIDWSQPADEIDRQIRALNPWPGTYTNDLKIKQAALTDQTTDKSAGTILEKKGHVACGEQTVLQLKSVQPAGKKPMDFASALNGGYVRVGDKLT